MYRILFVCHGNICRSCMAEFYFRELSERSGMKDCFFIASAATHADEIWNGTGNPMYPYAIAEMKKRGINRRDMYKKRARMLVPSDYAAYDMLIGMDEENMSDMKDLFHGDPDHKLHLMMEYAGEKRDVSDPWYTRDFAGAMDDIIRGCDGLMKQCSENYQS